MSSIYYLLTEREVCAGEMSNGCFKTKTQVRYLTGTDRTSEVRPRSVQKQRSDISLVQREQARSISRLLYGFTKIKQTSAKLKNVRGLKFCRHFI